MPLYAASFDAGLNDPAWAAEYRRLVVEMASANVRAGGAYKIDNRNRGALDQLRDAENQAWLAQMLPGGYSMAHGRPEATPAELDLRYRYGYYQDMIAIGVSSPEITDIKAEWSQYANRAVPVDGDGYFIFAGPPGVTPVQALSDQVGTYNDKAGLWSRVLDATAYGVIAAGVASAASAAVSGSGGASAGAAGGGTAGGAPVSGIPQFIAAPAAESTIPEYIAAGTLPAPTGLDAVLSAVNSSTAGLTGSSVAASVSLNDAAAWALQQGQKLAVSVASKEIANRLIPKPDVSSLTGQTQQAMASPAAAVPAAPSPAVPLTWFDKLVDFVWHLLSPITPA